jgi:hypothetical protein
VVSAAGPYNRNLDFLDRNIKKNKKIKICQSDYNQFPEEVVPTPETPHQTIDNVEGCS